PGRREGACRRRLRRFPSADNLFGRLVVLFCHHHSYQSCRWQFAYSSLKKFSFYPPRESLHLQEVKNHVRFKAIGCFVESPHIPLHFSTIANLASSLHSVRVSLRNAAFCRYLESPSKQHK